MLPPDVRSWLRDDVLAHFVVAAVGHVPLVALGVPGRTLGKLQFHPRLMLALPVHSYANSIFLSRRIELDAACAPMEVDACAKADAERPAYEAKQAVCDGKTGQLGRPLKPLYNKPPLERQSNLTAPDRAPTPRYDAHEFCKADNAQVPRPRSAPMARDWCKRSNWLQRRLMRRALPPFFSACTTQPACPRQSWPAPVSPVLTPSRHCRRTRPNRRVRSAEPSRTALRLPAATRSENLAADHRTLAHRQESQAGD